MADGGFKNREENTGVRHVSVTHGHIAGQLAADSPDRHERGKPHGQRNDHVQGETGCERPP